MSPVVLSSGQAFKILNRVIGPVSVSVMDIMATGYVTAMETPDGPVQGVSPVPLPHFIPAVGDEIPLARAAGVGNAVELNDFRIGLPLASTSNHESLQSVN